MAAMEPEYSTDLPASKMWHNLKKHYHSFVSKLEPNDISSLMFQNDILTEDEYQELESMSTRRKRSDFFMMKMVGMQGRKPEAIRILCNALRESYDYLADKLCSPVTTASQLDPSSKTETSPSTCKFVHLNNLGNTEIMQLAVMAHIVVYLWNDRVSQHAIIAEQDTAAVLLILLQDSSTLSASFLKPGSSVLIRNAMWQGKEVIVKAEDILSSGPVHVSEIGLLAAKHLIESVNSADRTVSTRRPLSSNGLRKVEAIVLRVEHKIQTLVRSQVTELLKAKVKSEQEELWIELWSEKANTFLHPGQRWIFIGEMCTVMQKAYLRVRSAYCMQVTGDKFLDNSWLSEDGHLLGELLAIKLILYNACAKLGCHYKKINRNKICSCGAEYISSPPVKYIRSELIVKCPEGYKVQSLVSFYQPTSQLFAARDMKMDLSLGEEKLTSMLQKYLPMSVGMQIEKNVIQNIRCGPQENC